MQRLAITGLTLVAALGLGCPGGKGGKGGGTGPSGNGKRVTADAGVAAAVPVDAAPAARVTPGYKGVLPADGVTEAEQPCVYHAGADSYHLCLSGADGNCAHFGATCSPKDKCMFDRASSAYKSCAKIIEGRCEKFGANCTPASKCMYNPADDLYHSCAAPRGGKCPRYGATCLPK